MDHERARELRLRPTGLIASWGEMGAQAFPRGRGEGRVGRSLSSKERASPAYPA